MEPEGSIHKGSPIIPILSRIYPIPSTDTYFFTLTYSMAQQPLKSFDRPLMRVSLIHFQLHLFSTRGRVMGDKSIASWAN